MIKREIKCPKCQKTLVHSYSTAILEIICKCGCHIKLKHYEKKDGITNGNH